MNNEEKVRVEFPLGEVTTLVPLILVGIVPRPEIDERGITGKERWKAQGLEGKAYVEVNRSLAEIITRKLGRFRSRIVGS